MEEQLMPGTLETNYPRCNYERLLFLLIRTLAKFHSALHTLKNAIFWYIFHLIKPYCQSRIETTVPVFMKAGLCLRLPWLFEHMLPILLIIQHLISYVFCLMPKCSLFMYHDLMAWLQSSVLLDWRMYLELQLLNSINLLLLVMCVCPWWWLFPCLYNSSDQIVSKKSYWGLGSANL